MSSPIRYRAGRDEWIANFQRRTIQEALTSASVWYWRRRAATFTTVGTKHADEIAAACNNRAAFLERYGLDQQQLLVDPCPPRTAGTPG